MSVYVHVPVKDITHVRPAFLMASKGRSVPDGVAIDLNGATVLFTDLTEQNLRIIARRLIDVADAMLHASGTEVDIPLVFPADITNHVGG